MALDLLLLHYNGKLCSINMESKFFIILGNQLFNPKILSKNNCNEVFMAEDLGLCTYFKHHKAKLYLFLTAMREYRDELTKNSIKVNYFKLDQRDDKDKYSIFLAKFLKSKKINRIHMFEIEDKEFEFELVSKARKSLNILVDEDQKPIGGKWSFDEENRKKIPKGVEPPKKLKFKSSDHHNDIVNLINKNFNKHPGNLENIWFPVTRKGAEKQLEDFLKNKFTNFGIYEDAMLEGKNFLFHSCISALLNIGLLDPKTVIKKTMKFASDNNIPINSLEGFIRQIIGWREFIRGIYHEEGKFQIKQNYWNHERKLTKSWYEGTTGLDPLDDCIKTTFNDGYIHHIPRLMVISNIMNLAGISPKEIYKWFMEMYIDSSDWVMVPNVFGMATYADGGLMSTKPYTCGSNYILKMSNYKKGDWCDVLDGLYWKFTEENRTFYENNPRLALLTRSLDKMNPERKQHIFSQAEMFIEKNTN